METWTWPLANKWTWKLEAVGESGKEARDPGQFDKYDAIIQDQLTEGVVERAVDEPQGREFYIPHKPVIKETAETTKMRIVFDASAREIEKAQR